MLKERFYVLLSVILGKSSHKDVHANGLKTKLPSYIRIRY